VFGGITVDVLNRVVYVSHNVYRDAQTQIFFAPVLSTRRANIEDTRVLASGFVTADFDAVFEKQFHNTRDVGRSYRLMHKQLLSCVAYRQTLRLGINHDAIGHIEVAGCIDEDVAVPCPGLDHGNG